MPADISHHCFDLHFPGISDVEYLFMYLLAICIFFLEKCSGLLPIFKSGYYYYCCYCVACIPYVFWILTPHQTYDLQIFSPIL